MTVKELQTDVVVSPIDAIRVVADGDKLVFLDFCENEARIYNLLEERFRARVCLVRQDNLLSMKDWLDRYFKGEKDVFGEVKFCADDGVGEFGPASGGRVKFSTGGTDFQRRVWKELCNIPWGETRSYKGVASDIGNENEAQAVGQANKSNPIILLIPCHRVIRTGGGMRNWTGGLERHKRLIDHEKGNYLCQ